MPAYIIAVQQSKNGVYDMSTSTKTAGTRQLSGKTKGYLILIALLIVSWAVFKIITPGNFGSPSQILQYFQASLMATTGAVGFYFVMVMGMFDFSIGANIILSSVVGCVMATRFGLGYAGFVIGSIICAAIVGLLNGLFYVKLRIPSMIVTTGLALIYESLANYISAGVVQTLPSDMRFFGSIQGSIILSVIAFLVAYILLNYTKIGTYTYAIGSNEFVAKNMGINVNKYKVLAFIISGAFFGVEAILSISYGSSMVAVTGMSSMSRNFTPTMGCFFGMAFRKYGIPIQAIIIGEFMINIIFYGFIALGAPTAIQDVITGLALLIVITLTTKVDKGEIVK
jgi:ribose transport system permease protein